MKFFNLLEPGFKTQLNLPLHFCTLAKDDFSAKAVVDTSLGRWVVEAGVDKRGRFYFHGNEWVKFANEHHLQHGCLLLFEHRGSFLFHASVYDTSACEKLEFQHHSSHENADEIKPPEGCHTSQTAPGPRGANPTFSKILRECSGWDGEKKEFQHDSQATSPENADETKPPEGCHTSQTAPGRSGANPTFSRIMRECSGWDGEKKEFSCLYLPAKIWKPNNLQQKTEAVLRISGLETKEWKAKLAFYPDRRLMVRRGWYEFISANNIRKGQECHFEIVMDATQFGYSSNVIIINVTKALT